MILVFYMNISLDLNMLEFHICKISGTKKWAKGKKRETEVNQGTDS